MKIANLTSHIHPPQEENTHTIILLHGRGSHGPEFAEELFSSKTSNGKTLAASLPTWRWVFPTSKERWSTLFEEDMCAWFDAYSISDITAREELQVEGLRESVLSILKIIEDEIHLLGGRSSHVYIGGISQGMATALWTFFYTSASGRIREPLGGVVGFCGWFPFAQRIEHLVTSLDTTDGSRDTEGDRVKSAVSRWFRDTLGEESGDGTENISVLSTPVFLSHGTDDAWVEVTLGRQAARVLRRVGIDVEWSEFTGAEGDGHWVAEPEGFDQILGFLGRRSIS